MPEINAALARFILHDQADGQAGTVRQRRDADLLLLTQRPQIFCHDGTSW
jgi:hypothetical protein